MPLVKFVDMFSGIGGFREGLTRAGGFECVGHCEIDKYANRSYNALFDTKGEWFIEDARKADPGTMPDFQLLWGGFPCQTFSIAGTRKGFGDPRGTLFFELARLAEARKPPYLLFENVPYALLHIRYIMSCKQLCKVSSYYKVVVIKVPLQGQNATIDKVLWIGLNLLPQDGFGKAPTTALCF